MALDSRPGSDGAATLRLALVSAGALLVVMAGLVWLAGFGRLPSPQELTYHGTREACGARLVPVQSKSAKDLGLGKVLIASRDLGDENFADIPAVRSKFDSDPDSLWPRLIRKTEEKIAGNFRGRSAGSPCAAARAAARNDGGDPPFFISSYSAASPE
jgi:hypothetical protein